MSGTRVEDGHEKPRPLRPVSVRIDVAVPQVLSAATPPRQGQGAPSGTSMQTNELCLGWNAVIVDDEQHVTTCRCHGVRVPPVRGHGAERVCP